MNQCGHAERFPSVSRICCCRQHVRADFINMCVFHCCETKGTQAEGDPWVGWLLPCLCVCVCVLSSL